ncbi:MAG: hypothetical protein M5U28_28065 [Sandaracinaceae bacterium]|nr:hypothetical protein [Sandaracinaceae bacterium]
MTWEILDRIGAGGEAPEELADEREALGIRDGRAGSPTVCRVERGFLQVPDGHGTGGAARREHGPVAAAHVVREVVDVLLRDAELDGEHELVVAGVPERASGRHDLRHAVAVEGIDDATAIERVPSQAVGLPTQDAGDRVLVDLAHHGAEHRAAGGPRALRLLEHARDHDAACLGEGAQLIELRGDGRHLSVVLLRRLAGVKKVGRHMVGLKRTVIAPSRNLRRGRSVKFDLWRSGSIVRDHEHAVAHVNKALCQGASTVERELLAVLGPPDGAELVDRFGRQTHGISSRRQSARVQIHHAAARSARGMGPRNRKRSQWLLFVVLAVDETMAALGPIPRFGAPRRS